MDWQQAAISPAHGVVLCILLFVYCHCALLGIMTAALARVAPTAP